MKRVEKRWKAFGFDVCPISWGLGLDTFWGNDEKLFGISFLCFHLTLILDKKKQKLLRRLGYKK